MNKNSRFETSTVIERHKRTGEKVKIITLRRKDKGKLNPKDIRTIASRMQDENEDKQLMIKAMTNYGIYQLKGYDQEIDVILDDESYLRGDIKTVKNADNIISKVSLYLI